MAILINHMAVNQPSGSQTYGPALIPNNLTQVIFKLARNTTATPLFWPLTETTLSLDFEVSFNAGQTWQPVCGATAQGGLVIGKGGVEAAETVVACPIPPGSARRCRVIVVVANGPLVSELTVEVL